MSIDTHTAWMRAEHLSEIGRHKDAEREMRGALASAPNDAFSHAMLAKYLYLQDKDHAALDEADEAIRLDPDSDMGYFIRAWILIDGNKPKRALPAAERTVELDSESPDNLGLLARCYERLNRWPEALDAAERGLSHDPQHARCAAVRADALRALGRGDEAHAVLRGALEDDPENAENHANLGWHALRAGQRMEAMVHFREALRLQPEMTYARQGLAAAMQSRSPLYGWFFRFRLWLSDKPTWWPWGLLIIGWFAPRLITNLTPGTVWGPVAASLVREMAFIFWYLWSLLPAIGTILLWTDRDGRHALNDEQRKAVKWFLPALLVAAAAAIGSPWLGQWLTIWLLLPSLVVAHMVTSTYSIPAGKRRRRMAVLSWITVLVSLFPVTMMLLVMFATDAVKQMPFWITLPLLLFAIFPLPILIFVLVVCVASDAIAKWIAGPEGTRVTIY